MADEKYVVLMTLPLDQKIESNVYFLGLPVKLKDQLIKLEELSQKESKTGYLFHKETYNLPLNSLKNIFRVFLPGVTDMKAVSANTRDDRWIISLEPIQVSMVVKLIQVWIDTFYIAELQGKKKHEAKIRTKELAQSIIDSLTEDTFSGCLSEAHIVLFENGQVADQDAYSLLPLMVVNQMIGKKVIVSGKESHWMYSGKNELVTDPMDYGSAKTDDRFSYVVQFGVQTIPPYNKPYLNVQVFSRRWVSTRKTDAKIYIADKKSVYFRMGGDKLQRFQAEYDYDDHEVEWLYQDRKIFSALFGQAVMPAFETVIASPETFMTGSDYSDMYIVYENGMKEKQRDLHSQDAGISHRDRKNIFDNIVNEIADLSSEEELKAYRVKGKSELAPVMFEDNFELSSERKDGFLENIENVLKNGPVTVEVWYSSGEELIRDHLLAALNLHLKNTDISVQSYNLKDYAEKLELRNEKAKENLEGIRKRQTEVADYICSTAGRADGTTIAIVIFHEKKYYEAESVKNPKLDPKLALRCGFASTGRLTQFLTEEAYKEKSEKNLGQPDRIRQDGKPEKSNAYNMVIRNTILDVYRQLGFINSLSDKRSVLNRTMLDEKIAVGIHVVSERKLMNKIRMKACPIIVSCNLVSHEIWVDAAFLIQQKQGGNLPELCEISCTYSEFPIRFLQMLEKAGEDKQISPVPAFLEEWFHKLDPDKKYEIMVVADGTSRKVIEGISNKEIALNYSPADENVVKLPLNGKNRTSITLSDYDNIDLIRLRTNAEVPDYYPEENIGSDAETGNFVRSYGLYVLENIFYSRDASPRREGITHKEDSSKLSTDKSFQHRKMIEIFPMYVSNPEEKIACVWDVHNLRNISIQYEATMTELPLPLHLGKLLEEYFIAH